MNGLRVGILLRDAAWLADTLSLGDSIKSNQFVRTYIYVGEGHEHEQE